MRIVIWTAVVMKTTTKNEQQDPVVASLANRTAHPYSSIAMSSNRRHAIVAGKGKEEEGKNTRILYIENFFGPNIRLASTTKIHCS